MELREDAEKLLTNIITLDALASANVEAVKKLLPRMTDCYEVRGYAKNETIVQDGRIVDPAILGNTKFNYATVPLGLVMRGEITIVRGGKGVKRLEAGDFIGLFETSDWIVNGRTRHIGDWTLLANNDVSVLFFDASMFNNQKDFCDYLSALARIDRVPKPLSALPLLDWVASHTTDSRLSDCAIIAHTHVLPTSVSLFRHLAHLVEFGNIFVLDKPYSSVRSCLNELIKSGVEVIPMTIESGAPYEFSLRKGVDLLWQRVIEAQKKSGFKKLLILDDGGDLWLSIPWADLEGVRIAGVEQTQRGIARIQDSSLKIPPIVSVATSGIKKIVEAGFIGAGVVAKLQASGELDKANVVGVVGTGSIGAAVIESLKKIGKDVLSYDNSVHAVPSNSPANRNSIDALMREADLIIGATGTDAFKGVTFDRVTGVKVLASASSADVEFQSLLKQTTYPKDVFGTVSVPIHDGLTLEILNGGFPVNFDRESGWVASEDIVLTRCMLYIGIMQAAQILTEKNFTSGIYTLDEIAQEKMFAHWIADKKSAGADLPAEYLNIQDIVRAAFLKNSKIMATVWRE